MLLTFEQQNKLVDQGLAKRSDNGYLSTFKYARKVMYDYLWNKHPELLECRGHTYNNITGDLIVAAPRKTFNYLENGTWLGKPLRESVTAYRKYNGFMACASSCAGEVVVSTTGSTKSQYVELAKDALGRHGRFSKDFNGTLLFEIIDPSDPHIVKEQTEGAVYLGYRHNTSGVFKPSTDTEYLGIDTTEDALVVCKTDRGEGFMLYDSQGHCCKMKTEYYIGKKKLMRMNKQKVKHMWQYPLAVQATLPPYWNCAVDFILSTQTLESWLEMTDQQRRAELEKFV